jgi:hypothetical protein
MSNAERSDRVSPETSCSDEKLRYRRQFVVGPRHPEDGTPRPRPQAAEDQVRLRLGAGLR